MIRGIPFEPCFDLNRTDARSFRGSLAGMSFASCQFTVGPGWPARQCHSPGRPFPYKPILPAGPADCSELLLRRLSHLVVDGLTFSTIGQSGAKLGEPEHLVLSSRITRSLS